MTKISMAELHDMLGDIETPDAAIAPYLTILPELSAPFAPVAVPDPAKVETRRPLEGFQAEAAMGMTMMCAWARWRR